MYRSCQDFRVLAWAEKLMRLAVMGAFPMPSVFQGNMGFSETRVCEKTGSFAGRVSRDSVDVRCTLFGSPGGVQPHSYWGIV